MGFVRNIHIKLDVPMDGHSILDEAFEVFCQAAQYVADTGWNDAMQIEDTKKHAPRTDLLRRLGADLPTSQSRPIRSQPRCRRSLSVQSAL